MLPCDLSTEEVFTELRRPPAPVDILIASLVFDVVCVDTEQLEVRGVKPHKRHLPYVDLKVMMRRALRWLKPEGLMFVQVDTSEGGVWKMTNKTS